MLRRELTIVLTRSSGDQAVVTRRNAKKSEVALSVSQRRFSFIWMVKGDFDSFQRRPIGLSDASVECALGLRFVTDTLIGQHHLQDGLNLAFTAYFGTEIGGGIGE